MAKAEDRRCCSAHPHQRNGWGDQSTVQARRLKSMLVVLCWRSCSSGLQHAAVAGIRRVKWHENQQIAGKAEVTARLTVVPRPSGFESKGDCAQLQSKEKHEETFRRPQSRRAKKTCELVSDAAI
jgi:hypothetical protein